MALHRTAIPLRSIAAGELVVKIANVNIVNPGLLPISRCSAISY